MANPLVAQHFDYTVFGDYFWTGKGFGINLADDDGFQTTVASTTVPTAARITAT